MKISGRFGCASIFALTVLTISQAGGRVLAKDVNVDSLQVAAGKGDAKSQYDLARCYEKGEGVTEDYAKAALYMRRSADQGYASAETHLGYYYGEGLGVTGNLDEALKWYPKGG